MKMFDSDENQPGDNGGAAPASGGNCPDDVKRSFYRSALIAKIAADDAQATFKRKNGAYRAVLKEAEKAGVQSDAITYALERRMQDPDLVLIEERERIKMLDISGLLPGIKERLFSRLDVMEATGKESFEMALADARDKGAYAGRLGLKADKCEHLPGTELYVNWMQGYRSGQQAIADEMNPDGVISLPTRRGRPLGSKNKPPAAAQAPEGAVEAEASGEVEAALHHVLDDAGIPQ